MVIRGAALQGVSHIGLCFSTMPGLFGETSPNKPIVSRIGYTQRGGLCEQSEYLVRSPGAWRHQRVAMVVHIQWSGSMAGLQGVSSGKTRLQCWVVRALSSYNPPGEGVPLISVSRWNPIQVSRLGILGVLDPSWRVFPLNPLTLVLT